MARKYTRDLKVIEKERQKRAAIKIQRYLGLVGDIASICKSSCNFIRE